MEITSYLQGVICGGIKWDLALEKRIKDSRFLESYGYKVYSQNDEDGIINEIFKRIGVANHSFVEFGVDIGIESNCHSLLLQGWHGLWIEGRETAYQQILRRFAPVIREGRLTVYNTYVLRENINSLLQEYLDKERELDLLSIDVDGNDWHIWKAVEVVRPRVVVIEYNAKFTPEIEWKMPYNIDHIWDGSDREGSSLKGLELLGKEKGYQLVGTNIAGINAFFVRADLAGDLFALPATAENLYNPARYCKGLYHISGHPGLNCVDSDVEGMKGIFEYYPDWNCLTTFGFHKVVVYPDYRKFTMSQKEGKLFARFMPKGTKKVLFKYSLSVPVELLKQEITVSICIANEKEKSFFINDTNGYLEIPVLGNYAYEEIVPITIKTDTLFVADRYIHNGDKREQSISIEGVYYSDDKLQ